jgi:hypothetical protein
MKIDGTQDKLSELTLAMENLSQGRFAVRLINLCCMSRLLE